MAIKDQYCMKANCYEPPVDFLSGYCKKHEKYLDKARKMDLEEMRKQFRESKGTPWKFSH